MESITPFVDNFYAIFIEMTIYYFLPYSFAFLIFVIVTLVVYYIIWRTTYFTWALLKYTNSNNLTKTIKKVLIVTAHPDDECMFFGPLIITLIKERQMVYLLCLSNGNAEDKGLLRKKELFDSCKVLGIPAGNVFLSCNSMRPDGLKYMWDFNYTASPILHMVGTFDIDTLVTFDSGGVSGHANHISLFNVVYYLNECRQLPFNCRVLLLDSTGLLRKYWSVIDCFVSLIVSNNTFILSSSEHRTLVEAMKMHKTQYVWFRKLYMSFSRYSYVNTFSEQLPPKE